MQEFCLCSLITIIAVIITKIILNYYTLPYGKVRIEVLHVNETKLGLAQYLLTPQVIFKQINKNKVNKK